MRDLDYYTNSAAQKLNIAVESYKPGPWIVAPPPQSATINALDAAVARYTDRVQMSPEPSLPSPRDWQDTSPSNWDIISSAAAVPITSLAAYPERLAQGAAYIMQKGSEAASAVTKYSMFPSLSDIFDESADAWQTIVRDGFKTANQADAARADFSNIAGDIVGPFGEFAVGAQDTVLNLGLDILAIPAIADVGANIKASVDSVISHIDDISPYKSFDVNRSPFTPVDYIPGQLERQNLYRPAELEIMGRYHATAGAGKPFGDLSLSEKLLFRDMPSPGDLTKAYRYTTIEEVQDASVRGYYGIDRPTDWYYGGGDRKYGDVLLETTPMKKNFDFRRGHDGESYAGIITGDPDIMHLRGSMVPFDTVKAYKDGHRIDVQDIFEK